MVMTGKLYGKAFTSLWNKEIDYDTDQIDVVLTTVSEVPDQDADDYLDDLSNEVSGGGYVRKTLASKTVTYTGGTNKLKLDAADVQWTAATFTFRNAHVVDVTPVTNATRPLIGYQASDADITGGGGNLDLVWHADGIVEITVS